MARFFIQYNGKGTIVQIESAAALLPLVETTLKLCERAGREQAWSLLATAPLAATPLVTTLLADAERTRPEQIGLATYAVIQWGIDQLRADGAPSWTAYGWRTYLILFHAYLQGVSFTHLAEKLMISEQTVYQSRRNAVARLAKLLYNELTAPQAIDLRTLYYIGRRYQRYTPGEQAILQLVVIVTNSENPLPLSALTTLAVQTSDQPAEQLQQQIHYLLATGALLADASAPASPTITLAPPFGHYLTTLGAGELTAAYRRLAAFYCATSEWPHASDHFQQAGDHQSAALLLVTHQRTLVNNGETAQLLAALQRFTPDQVDGACWAQIQLLVGDLALQQQDLQRAVRAYQGALGAVDVATKALAYYKRARAFLSLNLDETLLHYEMAIDLLTAAQPTHPLLTRIQCDRAWFYIQEKPNLPKAAALLTELDATLPSLDCLGRSYVANAWAELYHYKAQDDVALEQRLRAWLLANESLDREWTIIVGYNLGNDYVALGQYSQALTYYRQSRELAHHTGDQAMQGLIEKAIGGAYFWLADYAGALAHYQAGYTHLRRIGRNHWLVNLCYDLAEVYALLWDYPAFCRYLAEGRQLCEQLRNHQLLAQLETLSATLAWMHPFNDRQRAALHQVKTTGAITNRDYQTITGCAQRQAVRDLNELCDQRILRREGEGRGVRYVAVNQ